ncbi:unnamed protein product [Larinioides sclopetarius]|uniref:Uncharacterized protein n=1 Tax=Larinioides sclopetarius TaxID=280406 RepID=A0AAV2ASP9_9ARAC
MAAQDQIEGRRASLVDGHLIQYSDHLPISAYAVLYHFDRSFTFLCNVLPTSWAFRVTFRKEPNDCCVSCQVFIARTDQSRIPMDFDFWIQAIPGFSIDLPPRSFKIRGILGGHQAIWTFDAVVPYEVLRQLVYRPLMFQLVYQPLAFQVSFSAHGCHGDDCLQKHFRSVSKATEYRKPEALHSNL